MVDTIIKAVFYIFVWLVERKAGDKLSKEQLIEYIDAHRKQTNRAAEASQETEDRIAEMDRGEGT